MQTPNDYQLFELSLLLKGTSHNHKTFFKRYKECLNGKEIVDYICNVDLVDQRTDAITIGSRLLEAGLIVPVKKKSTKEFFDNKSAIYQFSPRQEFVDKLLKEKNEEVNELHRREVKIPEHKCSSLTKFCLFPSLYLNGSLLIYALELGLGFQFAFAGFAYLFYVLYQQNSDNKKMADDTSSLRETPGGEGKLEHVWRLLDAGEIDGIDDIIANYSKSVGHWFTKDYAVVLYETWKTKDRFLLNCSRMKNICALTGWKSKSDLCAQTLKDVLLSGWLQLIDSPAKNGTYVLYLETKRMDFSNFNNKQFCQTILYLFLRTSKLAEVAERKVSLIVDFNSVPLGAVRKLRQVDTNRYAALADTAPTKISQTIFVNMPFYLSFVKLLVPNDKDAGVMFLNNTQLMDLVGEKVLPKTLGGQLEDSDWHKTVTKWIEEETSP